MSFLFGKSKKSSKADGRSATTGEEEAVDQRSQSSTVLKNGSDDLYPWSKKVVVVDGQKSSADLFPRVAHSANSTIAKDGKIYLFGGLHCRDKLVKDDIWMLAVSRDHVSARQLSTSNEGPSARVGHSALLVGNAFIVFGGDNRLHPADALDNCLYFLNTSSLQWSKPSCSSDASPCGRYGHSLSILGSRLFVFGGESDGQFFNDLVTFDLGRLQHDCDWSLIVPKSSSERVIPVPRANHSMVVYRETLYLFGGADSNIGFNDVWSFDLQTNTWKQIDCIGYIPSPREGHSAAIVADVMYVFGGRSQTGRVLGDLAAFRISSQRWYTFQNMGFAPSPRSGHVMTTTGLSIVILGGAETETSSHNEVFVLDTTKIKYPAEELLPSRSLNRVAWVADTQHSATRFGSLSKIEIQHLGWLSAEFLGSANGIQTVSSPPPLQLLLDIRSRLLELKDTVSRFRPSPAFKKLEWQRNIAVKEVIRAHALLQLTTGCILAMRNHLEDIRLEFTGLSTIASSCTLIRDQGLRNNQQSKVLQDCGLRKNWRTAPSHENVRFLAITQAAVLHSYRLLRRSSLLQRENEAKLYEHLEEAKKSTQRIEWHFCNTIFLLKQNQSLIFGGIKSLETRLYDLRLASVSNAVSDGYSVCFEANTERYFRPLSTARPGAEPIGFDRDRKSAKLNSAAYIIRRHSRYNGRPFLHQTLAESENKYRVALTYVKHVEKMLRKVNQEMIKYKEEAQDLRLKGR